MAGNETLNLMVCRKMSAVGLLASFSFVSLLTYGYLSWGTADGSSQNTQSQEDTSISKPHIIFILVDDQGYRDIGYHGSEIRTPTLDRLAAQGVKLENYYVQPICSPSRSQFITGKYQIHTGLQHSIIRPTQANCLPLNNMTLPQKLKNSGYSTHMIGKWHLGFYRKECMPTQRGFDTFFGYLLGSGDYYSHYKCDSPRMCGYDFYENDKAAWEYDKKMYSTYMYTQKVEQILISHNPKKPLFLYLAFQAVHTPLQVPMHYVERYRSITNIHRRRYAAMVTCLDEAINNVTRALKKYGYYNNSILIYSSDNGGQPKAGGSNWPLRGTKGSYWEGGIRAVGFVHSPLLKKRGSVCRKLLHITDWYPTLVTLADGQLDEEFHLDGFDVWETISEGRHSPRKDILHNIDPLYTKARNGSWEAGFMIWNTAIQAAIRVGPWKLLTGNPGYSDWVPPQAFTSVALSRWHSERVSLDIGQSVWLFNITADPYERIDLSSKYPKVVKQLLKKLAQYNKTAVPVRYPPRDPRSNPRLNGGVWGPWYKDNRRQSKPGAKHFVKTYIKKKQ
ncbi:arylsulfatase J [Protopterus annectens]|uniref:arylsulfatase J n=1 Tax=Protopterus annectens TaxID=7888 RepID=UPI001CF9446D|nr:arylsulfatase J [Protopterus annectens]